MIIATNPRGQRVYFDEKTHRYFHGDLELTSVTRFIRGFFPEFDKVNVALTYAKKHGKSVNEVLAAWDAKGEYASDLGHTIHAYAQALVLGSTPPKVKDEWIPFCASVDKALAKMTQKFEFIEPEKLVFSVELGLAGTIDLLVRDKENGDVVIIDWKTNEKVEFVSKWGSALKPIGHLDDANGNEYRLQVNTYRKILLHENYYLDASNFRMALIHLKPDGPVFYPIDIMTDEINSMLRWL